LASSKRLSQMKRAAEAARLKLVTLDKAQ
jgi:hypothetical protein